MSVSKRRREPEPDQVAGLRRRPGKLAVTEADAGLEVGADAEHGTARGGVERDRHRDVAARAPDHQRREGGDPDHRVLGGRLDRPVVDQEGVGDVAEPLDGIAVLVGDRLRRDVPRGHHQRPAGRGDQEVVQGGVRQHHPEVAAAGRDGVGHRRRRKPWREHDRSLRPQQCPFGVVRAANEAPRPHRGPRRGSRTASCRGACGAAARRPRRYGRRGRPGASRRRPLTATIRPPGEQRSPPPRPRRGGGGGSGAPPRSRSVACGPHSGQAFASA